MAATVPSRRIEGERREERAVYSVTTHVKTIPLKGLVN